MTPLELQILIHYFAQVGDFRDGDFAAPAVRRAIDQFSTTLDLLRSTQGEGKFNAAYEITDRGRVFVEHLLAQPLPVQTWVMP